MRKRNLFDYISVSLGIFVFIAYVSYFIKLLIWPESALPLVVCIAVMVLSAAPIVWHKKLSEIIPYKLFMVLKWIYFSAAVFYTVTFIALCAYIYSVNASAVQADSVDSKTVIVVYGAGLEDGVPGKALVKRLDKALELYMAGDEKAMILVSGGQGKDEPCTEASAMMDYLVARGVSEDKIILEDESTDTKENVRYSFEKIKELGLDDYTVVSISNAFHVPRIRLLCEMNGFETEVALARDPSGTTVFASLVREYMSYVKIIVTGHD